MERNQALEILETINELYPQFELTDRKVKIMLLQLEKMDYDRVMARLNEHIVNSPFPPTLAEIAAYAPEENKHLEQIQKWREEAAKVSPEVKERFRKELERLAQKIEEKNK